MITQAEMVNATIEAQRAALRKVRAERDELIEERDALEALQVDTDQALTNALREVEAIRKERDECRSQLADAVGSSSRSLQRASSELENIIESLRKTVIAQEITIERLQFAIDSMTTDCEV